MPVRSFIVLLLLSIALPSAAAEEPYRLGPEDLLQIQVWSRPDLSVQVQVEVTGEIRLALLGSVPAQDRTVDELGSDLTRRYGLLDARISEVLVTVVEYRSRAVTVVGEVKAPSRVAFRTIPNLWEVLLATGGPTPQADLSQVQIVRKEKREGEDPTLTVDLSKGLEGTDLSTLPEVRPLDTVVVPSLVGESVIGDNFQVLGSVTNPGVYKLQGAATVVEALALSGGPTTEADLSKVHLTRSTPDGVAAYELDVDGHLKRGLPLVDMPLKAGDTITVPERGGIDMGNLITRVVGLASLITAVSSIILIAE